MDTFRNSLKKVSQLKRVEQPEVKDLMNLTEQLHLLQGSYNSQMEAMDDLYQTSRVCSQSLQTMQFVDGVSLIPVILNFPENSHSLSVGSKFSYIAESINQFFCIIEHFAEEVTTLEDSLQLTNRVTETAANLDIDIPQLNFEELIIDESMYISTTSSVMMPTQTSTDINQLPTVNILTPPSSPVAEQQKSKTKQDVEVQKPQDKPRRALPGSAASLRGNRKS